MIREEAYKAMQAGMKIQHRYFTNDEYYHMVPGHGVRIVAEDGVNHTKVFWDEADGNWRKDGWEVKE